jgi:hypothetical protein
MTTITASTTTAEDRLRGVLRLDAVVTGALGLLALVGPSWYGGPAWVARAVGAVLVVVALEVAMWSREGGDRLRLRGTVVADAAFAWVVTVLLAAWLVDMDAAGREVLVLTALATLGFGISETALVRRMK